MVAVTQRADPAPASDRRSVLNPHRVGLVSVLAVGLLLRLWQLNSIGLNSDEAVYTGQAGAFAGDPAFVSQFSLFRAHPLFLQVMLTPIFRITGVHDIVARVFVAVVFGTGAIYLTWLLGRDLYNSRVALIAAAFVAVLPYHVLISRQVLVDTPMAFFVTLGMWLFVAGAKRKSRAMVVGAFAAMGLAALTKEIAVFAIVPLMLLCLGAARLRVLRASILRHSLIVYTLILLPFPLTRFVKAKNASQFILWQFERPPNHGADYFGRISMQYMGPVVLALFALGLIMLIRRRDAEDWVLLIWAGIFGTFFQFWPTKLFPYLLVIVPAIAIVAGVAVDRTLHIVRMHVVGVAATVALCAQLALFAVKVTDPTEFIHPGMGDFDVEIQSFAGSREMAVWVRDHTPERARFLTIGPSLGNILRFYAHRDSVALSVSPDPAKRNPSYVPITNPDHALRNMGLHYIAWDAYSADRSSFYNNRISQFARKYAERTVLSVSVDDGGNLVVREGPPPPGTERRLEVWSVRPDLSVIPDVDSAQP